MVPLIHFGLADDGKKYLVDSLLSSLIGNSPLRFFHTTCGGIIRKQEIRKKVRFSRIVFNSGSNGHNPREGRNELFDDDKLVSRHVCENLFRPREPANHWSLHLVFIGKAVRNHEGHPGRERVQYGNPHQTQPSLTGNFYAAVQVELIVDLTGHQENLYDRVRAVRQDGATEETA
jgi:hypothetical protein